jgi:hypothetical protein
LETVHLRLLLARRTFVHSLLVVVAAAVQTVVAVVLAER